MLEQKQNTSCSGRPIRGPGTSEVSTETAGQSTPPQVARRAGCAVITDMGGETEFEDVDEYEKIREPPPRREAPHSKKQK